MSYSQRPHVDFRQALFYGIAILPAVLIGLLIWTYSVDIPQWEDWIMVPHFEKFAAGTLPVAELFGQQNEYRQFFPNLLFIGLGWLTKWDLRYEMLVSFILALFISINVFRLSRSTTNDEGHRIWLYLIANVLIFSTAQHENWFQGQQVIYFVPIACITTALTIASSTRFSITGKCLASAVLSVISTFSSANGFICWLVVLPMLVWYPTVPSSARQRWIVTVTWLMGLALSMKVYFHELQNPPTLSRLTNGFPLGRGCLFFLSLLGSTFSMGQTALAIPIGAFLLALFAFTCKQFLHVRSNPVVARPMITWLMLGMYSIATAVLITFGRVGFGLQYALQNRYTTYTLYLPVALIYLTPLVLPLTRPHQGSYVRSVQTRFVPLLAATLIAAHLPIYLRDFRYVNVYRRSLLQAKACLLFGNVVQDPCSAFLYPPHSAVLQTYANKLDALGFMRPHLAQPEWLPTQNAESTDYGEFLQVVQVGTDNYIASGSAILPHRSETPDLVILAYERDGVAHPFAIATLETETDVVSALMHKGVWGDARWSKSFSVSRLPVNPIRLTAWGFDAYTGKVYRIPGTHTLLKNTDSAQ